MASDHFNVLKIADLQRGLKIFQRHYPEALIYSDWGEILVQTNDEQYGSIKEGGDEEEELVALGWVFRDKQRSWIVYYSG